MVLAGAAGLGTRDPNVFQADLYMLLYLLLYNTYNIFINNILDRIR